MTTGTPTASGGLVVTWSISPTLPTGITIDSSTGEISGTPTVISTVTTYTITATNSGGSATTTIDITVNDVAPSGITYSGDPFSLTKDSTVSATPPTYRVEQYFLVSISKSSDRIDMTLQLVQLLEHLLT